MLVMDGTNVLKSFGIRHLKITGEKLLSQPHLVAPFKQELRLKMKEFDLNERQIYNAGETNGSLGVNKQFSR